MRANLVARHPIDDVGNAFIFVVDHVDVVLIGEHVVKRDAHCVGNKAPHRQVAAIDVQREHVGNHRAGDYQLSLRVRTKERARFN